MAASPGLDPVALRGLLTSKRPLATIRDRIEDHLDNHEGYVPVSGGKDSTVVLHLVHQVDPEVPVVFFDSGLAYPETVQFLGELAQRWCLNFHTIRSQPTALEVLASSGGWDHRGQGWRTPSFFDSVIAAPAGQAHDWFGPGELWGVRGQESRGRRMAYSKALKAEEDRCGQCAPERARERHGGRIARVDGTVAYGPIWDWSTQEVWSYLERHKVPVNPVYEKLRALGAPESALRVDGVVDGAHLERGRLVWLRRGWPQLFEQLADVLPRMREFA